MARIAEEEIERLAEARGVQLKRHGADLIGLCPFHEDHSPLSLHKYLYTHADAVNGVDPGGHQDYVSEVAAEGISVTADTAPIINVFQTINGVRAALTVSSGLAAKVLTDPNVIEEINGSGEAGIAVVQRSFLQVETVEQGGVNASRFGRALQSFGNIIPLPEDVHQLISNFYSSNSYSWLSNGQRVRDWMANQDWETQWSIGLQIAKEAFLTGKITWHP